MNIRHRHSSFILSSVAVLALLGQSAWLAADEPSSSPSNTLRSNRQWTAEQLFKAGSAQSMQLGGTVGGVSDAAVQLMPGVLVEDDGPAAGYSYQPQTLRLAESIRIKKQLVVADSKARSATLLVAPGGQLQAQVNGRTAELQPLGKQGNYWQAYRFDPGLLRTGVNEIVLGGEGSVWLARDDEFALGSADRKQHPNRSLISRDNGESWQDRNLGTPPDADVDGEYLVRLYLDQYPAEGTLTMPVLDAGNLNHDWVVSPPLSQIQSVTCRVRADVPTGAQLAVEFRSSQHPSVAVAGWSDWSEVLSLADISATEESREFSLPLKSSARYFQLRFRAISQDRVVTPRILGFEVAVQAVCANDWYRHVELVDATNPSVVRSSIPFEYEPFDRPELSTLRRQFQLDKVVAGSKSEFELIQRLAAWSSKQFDKGHLGQIYPQWNALKILEPFEDGKPVGGFCQQYNLVFLQACESFGLVGRAISIGPGNRLDQIRGGHEVVEIWSNERRRWIYVDGNTAWYFEGPQGEPLSILDLHDRQMAEFNKLDGDSDVKVIYLTKNPGRRWEGLASWPPFIEVRLIPRSNFLEKPSPLPLNQGMRGWFWTGHYVWIDRLEPQRLLYSHRVAGRSDFEWTLNHVHLTVEATSTQGIVKLHFDNHTPNFAKYAVQNSGKILEDGDLPGHSVRWQLEPGEKSLFAITPVNTAGRAGSRTEVVLQYVMP